MAATVVIYVFHGAGPYGAGAVGSGTVEGTTVRLKRADDDALDDSVPTPIPTSGKNYSWRKSFKLGVTALPDNAIANLRFFSGLESLGSDRTILFNQASSYTQASSSDESAAISAVDVDTKTVGSPQVVNAGDVITSGDSAPTTGVQDFVELQLEIGTGATVGDSTSAKTLSYRFDET